MITVDINDIIKDEDKYRDIELLKIVGKLPKDCTFKKNSLKLTLIKR